MLQKGSLCCSCARAECETRFHLLERKSKHTCTAPLALQPFLLPTIRAGRIREKENFVAANSAAMKSISSDDFFNVPPWLPVKRLLAACLRVAPEEMTMMMRPRSQIQTRTWHQQDQDYVVEVGYGQLQVWEHQWLSLFVDHQNVNLIAEGCN